MTRIMFQVKQIARQHADKHFLSTNTEQLQCIEQADPGNPPINNA